MAVKLPAGQPHQNCGEKEFRLMKRISLPWNNLWSSQRSNAWLPPLYGATLSVGLVNIVLLRITATPL